MSRVVGSTARQHECLRLIREHKRETGWYPTIRWLGEKLGLKQHSHAHRMVSSLVDLGLVRVRKNYGIIACSMPHGRNDVGALYAALGSTPIGKIGDGRKVAA